MKQTPENMTKDDIKQVVLDIIADIAPDEDLTAVKPEVRLRDRLDGLPELAQLERAPAKMSLPVEPAPAARLGTERLPVNSGSAAVMTLSAEKR